MTTTPQPVPPLPPASPTKPLSWSWHERIDEIAEPWQRCFGTTEVMRCLPLHRAVERSHLQEVVFHYLVGTDEQGAACVAPCFAFRVSLVSVASAWVQRLVGWVRKAVPGFLQVRLFVVGSPISTCGDMLGLRELEVPGRWDHGRFTALFDQVTAKARELRIGLVLIKELEQALVDRLKPALEGRFLIVDSLPTTYVPIAPREQGGYEGSIRSKYRNKLKKRKAVGAEHGLTWEIQPHCRGQEAEVFRLYQQVIEHSHVVFEQLNQDFFLQVPEQLGAQACYLLGYKGQGDGRTLVASELVIADHTLIHPLYSGFDYWLKRDSNLYFNTFYAIIEEAERRGFARVHIGQTAYEVKAELGATCVPLFLAVHHRWAVGRFALRLLRSLLFPSTTYPVREVFNEPKPIKKRRKPQVSSAIPIVDARAEEAPAEGGGGEAPAAGTTRNQVP